MPDRIAHLALDDLPGISKATRNRLERAGVRDVVSLHALEPRHARLIWRSTEGDRFVRMLHGSDIPLQATQRGGFENSKVLAPAYRPARHACYVRLWLIEKAAFRLRREGRTTARFSFSISKERGGGE